MIAAMVDLVFGNRYFRFWKGTIAAQIHLAALILAINGTFVLLQVTLYKASWLDVAACLSFCLSAILVFSVSTLYHFVHDGLTMSEKWQNRFEELDHFAIYLLIAGTYTPFLMNTITSGWKLPLIVLVWVVAITGILYTKFKSYLPLLLQHRGVYTGLFILMGWTAIIRIGEIFDNLSKEQITLFAAGGLAYTVGAIGYAVRWPRFFHGFMGYHELWHLMVTFGFLFHYFLVMSFY